MTELLDQALRLMRTLPPERQDAAARLLLRAAGFEQEPYRLSDEERAAVRVGLDEANRGDFVSDAEMTAFWNRHDTE